MLALMIPLALLALSGTGSGDPVDLPIAEEVWESQTFAAPAPRGEPAAVFRIIEDPSVGPALAVGPWQSGRWAARYSCVRPLPFVQGTVRGLYRTKNIEERCGGVWVQYYTKGQYVHADRTTLEPAAEWRPFELVFRRPPPGTDAARLGLGLSRHTEGTVFFADVSVTDEVPPVGFPPEPGPITRPEPPEDLAPGKYFRLENRDDAWWLVSPSGKAFYSVGTDGPWYRDGDDRADKDQRHVSWLRRLKANSLAGWTDIERWARINDELMAGGETPFATFISMETGTWWGDFDHLRDAGGEPQSRNHAFPDPFDPGFARAYRSRVQQIAKLVRWKPWHGGWFADNEISHRNLHRYVYSSHCAEALRAFLEQRYQGDIGKLNQAWQTDFASFEAMVAGRPEPPERECTMTADFRLFAREIVKKYAEVTLEIIRDEDPGHLVFSPRLMFGDTEYVDLYSCYDAIAVNYYPSNNEPGLSAEAKERLRDVHERSGRPIIIGEWSVPAVDSGLYDDPDNLDWSWPQTVPTQTDRARQAACVTIDFYNLPFTIGAHWFIWYDFDSEERRANRGLFTASDEPWTEVIDALARAHTQIGEPVLAEPYGPAA